MNGTTTQAGLKQVIAERQQADLGTNGMGRLVITSPTPTSVKVAEDVAGSPFGFKLSSVSSSLTGCHGDRSVRLAGGVFGRSRRHQSQSGRQGQLHLQSARRHHRIRSPDGNQYDAAADRQLCDRRDLDGDGRQPQRRPEHARSARSPTPRWWRRQRLPPATISSTPTGPRLESWSTTRRRRRRRSPARRCCRVRPPPTRSPPISRPATPSPSTARTISFVASGATGNQLNVTDSVQTLLTQDRRDHRHLDAVDHRWRRRSRCTPTTPRACSVTSSNAAAFARSASAPPMTATQPPLRVGGAPLGSATTLVNGSANTVAWYTGNSGPGSARATATARVDQSQTVQYRRAGQRAGDPLAAPVDRGVCRGHDLADRSQFGRAESQR